MLSFSLLSFGVLFLFSNISNMNNIANFVHTAANLFIFLILLILLVFMAPIIDIGSCTIPILLF